MFNRFVAVAALIATSFTSLAQYGYDAVYNYDTDWGSFSGYLYMTDPAIENGVFSTNFNNPTYGGGDVPCNPSYQYHCDYLADDPIALTTTADGVATLDMGGEVEEATFYRGPGSTQFTFRSNVTETVIWTDFSTSNSQILENFLDEDQLVYAFNFQSLVFNPGSPVPTGQFVTTSQPVAVGSAFEVGVANLDGSNPLTVRYIPNQNKFLVFGGDFSMNFTCRAYEYTDPFMGGTYNLYGFVNTEETHYLNMFSPFLDLMDVEPCQDDTDVLDFDGDAGWSIEIDCGDGPTSYDMVDVNAGGSNVNAELYLDGEFVGNMFANVTTGLTINGDDVECYTVLTTSLGQVFTFGDPVVVASPGYFLPSPAPSDNVAIQVADNTEPVPAGYYLVDEVYYEAVSSYISSDDWCETVNFDQICVDGVARYIAHSYGEGVFTTTTPIYLDVEVTVVPNNYSTESTAIGFQEAATGAVFEDTNVSNIYQILGTQFSGLTNTTPFSIVLSDENAVGIALVVPSNNVNNAYFATTTDGSVIVNVSANDNVFIAVANGDGATFTVTEAGEGCTDNTACNFDPSAFIDDGSCTFATAILDCDGNCINDTDEDGICDENEIPGCTDDTACNFDPTATDDDGSCTNPLQALVDSLEAANATLTTDLENANNTIADLNGDLDGCEDDVTALTDSIDGLNNTIDGLNGDLAVANDNIVTLNNTIDELEGDLTDCTANYNFFYDAYNTLITNCNEEIALLNDEIFELNGDLNNCEDVVANLNDSINDLEGELANANMILGLTQFALDNCFDDNNALEATLDAAQSTIVDLTAENANLTDALNGCTDDVTNLDAYADELEDLNATLTNDLGVANDSIVTLNNTIDGLEGDLVECETFSAAYENAATFYSNELDAANATIAQLETDLSDCGDAVDYNLGLYNDATATIEALIAAADANADQCQMTIDYYINLLNNCQGDLETAEDEVLYWMDTYGAYVDNANGVIAQLQDELAACEEGADGTIYTYGDLMNAFQDGLDEGACGFACFETEEELQVFYDGAFHAGVLSVDCVDFDDVYDLGYEAGLEACENGTVGIDIVDMNNNVVTQVIGYYNELGQEINPNTHTGLIIRRHTDGTFSKYIRNVR